MYRFDKGFAGSWLFCLYLWLCPPLSVKKMAIFKDVEKDLTAIARLKASQLSDWRKERLADVSVFSDRLELLENIRSILKDPTVEPGAKNQPGSGKRLKSLFGWMKL